MAKKKAKASTKKNPREGSLTLLSWNVNGLRAVERKGFSTWLSEMSPDVLGLQETKAHPDQLSEALTAPEGYHAVFSAAEKKGYSGTAVYSREKPSKVERILGKKAFDGEGRVILAEFPLFTLVNVYVPNGRYDLSRVSYKLEFSDRLLEVCEKRRRRGEALILCGDFNTAHREIDLARPRENRKNTGFLPEECAWLDKFTGLGYVDTFRHFHPEKTGAYSWWDYRTRARPKNVGWRLDYFFITPDLLTRLRSGFILADVMGSDHCPVGIELAV
ncbi:MAG: exodeoxyribonuclease III [Planctomycetota bacterium]|jgi:exodeoxyribonuclease-3